MHPAETTIITSSFAAGLFLAPLRTLLHTHNHFLSLQFIVHELPATQASVWAWLHLLAKMSSAS